MGNEPFILKSVTRAREWVDAYATSLKIEKEESSSVLALLCGFGSWDVMVFAIESMPPTPCDESIGEDGASERFEGYMHVLVCLQNVRPAIAMFILERLSPSANYPFKAFTLEDALAEEAKAEDDDLDEELISDLGVLPSPLRVFTTARMCGHANQNEWANCLESIGWYVDPNSIGEDANIGEPSFEVVDENLGRIPVYLGSMTRTPETDDDPSVRLMMKACLGDFIQEYARDEVPHHVFFILWQFPQHKEISGNDYCCIGVRYSLVDESWKDILISQACDSPGRMLELNDKVGPIAEIGLSKSRVELADGGKTLGSTFAVILSGKFDPDEPPHAWNIQSDELDGSGWGRLHLPDFESADVED
ncbi:hypothetical protein [Pseudomonas sp. NPDC089569]|uniref:hypothetical protein n=1 Tax=Pseudomonas sp. NPDC089569 TaxID=3390722 RepID=UPI003D0940EE